MTRFELLRLTATLTVALGVPGLLAAQQTRTLDDLKGEYAAACGGNDERAAKTRLLLAYDRAIAIERDNAHKAGLVAARAAAAREPCRRPPAPAHAPAPASPSVLDPAASVAAAPVVNACDDPKHRYAAECRRWAPLLGRWSSRRFGGVIETVLTPDGTIVGTIVSDSKTIRDSGYTAGMAVLRGYRPRAATGTWLVMARGGEWFSAVYPGRKAGEVFGTSKWNGDTILFITRAAPDRLTVPATLESRLSNYDAWTRVGAR